MKKSLILISMFIFVTLCSAISKDYSPIIPDNITLFNSKSSPKYERNVFFQIKIDSVIENEGEKILYNHPSIIYDDKKGCFRNTPYSWLGKEIKLKNNFWQFVNVNNDTFFIMDKSEIESEWTFVNFPAHFKVKAKVTDFFVTDFDNKTDSVKAIHLTIAEHYDSTIKIYVINEPLLISKNYGILNWYNINNQPTNMFNNAGLLTFFTVNNPIYETFSKKDIYDYEIGDEFHTYEYYHSTIGTYSLSAILKVKSKKVTKTDKIKVDYVFKKIEKLYEKDIMYKIDTTTYFNADTAISYIFKNEDKLEYSKVGDFSDYKSDLVVSNYSFDEKLNKLAFVVNFILHYYENNECYYEPTDVGVTKYYKGIGGPFYFSSMEISTRGLLYYKKGDEEWGNPFKEEDLTVSVHEQNSTTDAYFNPISNNLIIKSDSEIFDKIISIFDINGKLVFENDINANWIQLPDLKNGLYFFKIKNQQNDLFYIGKFSILK